MERLIKILIILCFLTSCQTKEKIDTRIYQPDVLILTPDQTIKTVDGLYKVETTQKWHSHKTILELENKLSQF